MLGILWLYALAHCHKNTKHTAFKFNSPFLFENTPSVKRRFSTYFIEIRPVSFYFLIKTYSCEFPQESPWENTQTTLWLDQLLR
jgi:hypothetical protein